MMYGLFYMIDSLFGRNDPVKRFAERLNYFNKGQEDARKARNELSALKKPKYKP